jgi:hypothetical protein
MREVEDWAHRLQQQWERRLDALEAFLKSD